MASVVLLRGVNVGGHRTFRPKQLAQDLAHLDAVNIGAAGTFVIRERVPQAGLRAEIERRLPFATHIMICPGADLLRLVAADPFASEPSRRDIIRFVSVLARSPRGGPALPTALPERGPWQLRLTGRKGRLVYGLYRRNMKAIGYLGELDRVFGVPATTRNWHTIEAIAEVLRG